MVARILEDFEPVLDTLSLQAFMDGRFDVFLGDTPVYRAPEHRYRVPDYDEDIKPALQRLGGKQAVK